MSVGVHGGERWGRRALASVAMAGVMLAIGGCDRSDAAASGSAGSAAAITFGQTGLSPGQFTMPRCIEADGGSVWIIDKSARVQRFDARTGRATAYFRMPEWSLGKPVGLGVGPPPEGGWAGPDASASDRYLYIADTHYHRVLIYRVPTDAGPVDREQDRPALAASVGSYGRGPGEFVYPTDVAIQVDERGFAVRLFVGEYGGNDRISVLDARTLVYLYAIGGEGTAVGPDGHPLCRPQGLQIADGTLLVADSCNHRIGVFTLDGALVRWIGSPESAGEGAGQLAFPFGVAAVGDGTVMVAEVGNHRVQRFEVSSGESVGMVGRHGRGPGQIASPWGVAVVGDVAFVLDSGNDRVQGFEVDRRRRGTGR